MPSLCFLKKLFKRRSSSSSAGESTENKVSALPSFSKLKNSIRERCGLSKAENQTCAISANSIGENVSESNITFIPRLPALDGVGTDLQLDFDCKERQKLSNLASSQTDESTARSLSASEAEKSNLVSRQSPGQTSEHERTLTSAVESSSVNTRNPICLPSDPYSPSLVHQQPQASSIDVSYSLPTPSIATIPQSSSVRESRKQKTGSCSGGAATTRAASSNVVFHIDSDSSADHSGSADSPNSAEDAHTVPAQVSETSLSSNSEQEVNVCRRAIAEAPSAVDAQQALLDLADVTTTSISTGHVSEECSGGVTLGEEIVVRPAGLDLEADLRKVEDECLVLGGIVQSNWVGRIKRRAFDHRKITHSLREQGVQTVQAVSELHGQHNTSEYVVASEEAEELELAQQEEDFEAETRICDDKKQLIRQANISSINEPQACPLSRKESPNCNNLQSHTLFPDECKKRVGKTTSADLETALSKVVNKTAQSRIEELEAKVSEMSKSAEASNRHTATKLEQLDQAHSKIAELDSTCATWISQGSSRFALLYETKTGLSPDQWKDSAKKLTQTHHALLADSRRFQEQLVKLEKKQVQTESKLREAQTEAWVKGHLHEEVSRAFDLSKEMHKEANECVAALKEDLEALETRYKMSRKVSERMLADSWQTNAAKDERINILTSKSPPDGLRQALDDKQVHVHEMECRLVAAQRQLEALSDRLTDAKAEYTEVIMENKKLECQIGEAKVRLDHDYQDEERLKSELEKASASLNELKECAEGWQRIAVGELDKHPPAIIGQVRGIALQTLQDKLDDADSRNKALVDYNESLEKHLYDVEYELGINERRLTMDESIKIDFFERHWASVQEIFDENKVKTAMIKGYEDRFSEQLAKDPLNMPQVSSESFEEHVGPEFIDRSNALYRFADQAQEDRGEHDLRHSDLDKERIIAMYGHGPAGYQPRPKKEMPEGYPQRKAALEIAHLRRLVKDLRGRLWRLNGEAGDNQTQEVGQWDTKDANEAEENWETEEEGNSNMQL